jgi:hypothetical protein
MKVFIAEDAPATFANAARVHRKRLATLVALGAEHGLPEYLHGIAPPVPNLAEG